MDIKEPLILILQSLKMKPTTFSLLTLKQIQLTSISIFSLAKWNHLLTDPTQLPSCIIWFSELSLL